PSRGSHLELSIRGVFGNETTKFGTTGNHAEDFKENHSWFESRFKYQNYFSLLGPVTFGFDLEALYSNKPLFENYYASIISTPAYQPIPESKTVFINEFRTTEYAGVGLVTVVAIRKNLDFRVEGYGFQPFRSIIA